MTDESLRELLVKILDEMHEKAVNMKIKGVATGAVMNRDENTDWIGSFKVVDTSCNFAEGWNLIAISVGFLAVGDQSI